MCGARLRCGSSLAGRGDLSLGIGADLFKLGAQLLHTPFVRLCGGRSLGRSFGVSLGCLLLHCAGIAGPAFGHAARVVGLNELHERRKPLSGRNISRAALDELTLPSLFTTSSAGCQFGC